MSSILPKDTDVRLPEFTLVSASAGSGKTTQLTYRLLQLLMSRHVPHNKLQNILAITFTNNATAEMKQRTLEFLKRAALGDKELQRAFHEFLALEEGELQRRAENLIEEILENYSDFQVQTIDSFLTRVMKVSCLELGFPPEFDIVFENTRLLDESFAVFARDLAEDRDKRSLVERLIVLLNEQRDSGKRFLWNPYENLASEIKKIYEILSSHTGVPVVAEIPVQNAGLPAVDPDLSREEDDETDGQMMFNFSEGVPSGDEAVPADSRRALAYTYYEPYVRAYKLLADAMSKVQKQRSVLDLALANKTLALRIRGMEVPEIYFSLGERIHHFLIDEFQDTSPTQWAVVRPLIENSLSAQGSAFIVGDTKQAIYTFRGGDWKIMAGMLQRDEFPSVKTEHKTLSGNFRSGEAILAFTKKVFQEIVPGREGNTVASKSGLSTFEQHPDEKKKGRGYVEVNVFENEDVLAEKKKLLNVIDGCTKRKYEFRDITILTPKNRHVIEVSSWLNEAKIPFVSHSNLDIRARKVTGEVLAVLRFLDSPIDDLAFATVLLSDLFREVTVKEHIPINEFLFEARQHEQRRGALYTFFRDRYPRVWASYFEHLFNVVGYMPIYDLVAEVYKSFSLFDSFRHEEASLVKFLEVVSGFEATGTNSLRSFIRQAGESTDEEKWNIAVAPGENAVKVMTIHKAKGLGFPVSIVLLYDALDQRDNLAIVENDGEVQLVRVTKKLSEGDPEVERLYEEKRLLGKVDDLNKLYVALTRAKDELYVLSVKAKRGKTPSSYLPANGYTSGRKQEKQEEREKERRRASILHPHTRGFVPAKEIDQMRQEEIGRGEFIHAILERIEYVDKNLGKQVDAVIKRVQDETRRQFETKQVGKLLVAMLSGPFKSYVSHRAGRTVLTEQSVVSPDGKLHRIDRLVIDPDRVTVIDYKTGAEFEEHSGQVREYMKLVEQLYPGKIVEGLLAYVDLQTVRPVSSTMV